ncbi:MAG: MFS transporter [Gammaproteobacteria bacterium]|nr:MAG: MFS transporter [Gammaproteobacteria bacterium]
MQASNGSLTRLFMRTFSVRRDEIRGLLGSFLLLFLIWTAYSILRPVRETMGITSGVSRLPILFWATFVCTLAIQPAFGALATRLRRVTLLPTLYIFFASNLLLFYAWFYLQEDHTWIARAFFVWLSVVNLFWLSVFWSFMADIFSRDQSHRLFGFIAAGTSLGGLAGPLVTATLAASIGTLNLLLVAAALLVIAVPLVGMLNGWQIAQASSGVAECGGSDRPLGGNPFAGFGQVLANPVMAGIAVFVFLLTWVSTFLYLEQQALIDRLVPDSDAQTTLFGWIDFSVQSVALLIQMVLLGQLTRRFALTGLIVIVPALMVAGYLWLATNPVLWAIIGTMIVRRVGEYSIMRPCREMLFTSVPREMKYKAKNIIDTLVYRAGDAVSGSAHAGLVAAGMATSGIFGVAAGISALWGWSAYSAARRHEAARLGDGVAPPAPTSARST